MEEAKKVPYLVLGISVISVSTLLYGDILALAACTLITANLILGRMLKRLSLLHIRLLSIL